MFKLRDYQQTLIDSLRKSYTSGNKSPLLVAPCGSGKTVMFSYMCHSAIAKGKRVLILAHTTELVDQIAETLQKFGLDYAFIAAKRDSDYDKSVQVASVQSAVRRMDKIKPPDLIIVDEAHHCITGSSWGKILDKFPNAFRLGVTATPWRLSGEGLKDNFDDLVLGPSMRDLIDKNYLADYRIFIPSTIDTSGLKVRAGDFAIDDLCKVANTAKITGNAIKHYKKIAENKRAIVFCVNVDHAISVSERFESAGYSAAFIHGMMSKHERDATVAKFRKGEIKILTNCNIVSEGFDLPAIECAIILRPTMSLGLWIQQSGRALRPYDGKEQAVILDHAGNTMNLGFPDDDHEWSLERKKRKKSNAGSNINVKTCPSCFAATRAGTTQCFICGHIFVGEPKKITENDEALEEADRTKIRLMKKSEQSNAQSLEELTMLGRSRGYKNPEGWAKHIILAREKKWGSSQKPRYSQRSNLR